MENDTCQMATVDMDIQMDDHFYYQILSDYVGLPIEGSMS